MGKGFIFDEGWKGKAVEIYSKALKEPFIWRLDEMHQ